jgi:hypothetical protein
MRPSGQIFPRTVISKGAAAPGVAWKKLKLCVHNVCSELCTYSAYASRAPSHIFKFYHLCDRQNLPIWKVVPRQLPPCYRSFHRLISWDAQQCMLREGQSLDWPLARCPRMRNTFSCKLLTGPDSASDLQRSCFVRASEAQRRVSRGSGWVPAAHAEPDQSHSNRNSVSQSCDRNLADS